jgi:hypothetical protein
MRSGRQQIPDEILCLWTCKCPTIPPSFLFLKHLFLNRRQDNSHHSGHRPAPHFDFKERLLKKASSAKTGFAVGHY